MVLNLGTMAIGGGVLALIGGFWDKIKRFFQSVISFAICTVNVADPKLASAAIHHFYHNYKMSPFRTRSYTSGFMYVRPSGGWNHVGFENLLASPPTFRKGFFPIWVSAPEKNNKEKGGRYQYASGSGNLYSDNDPVITISFIRGTFNIDKVMKHAIEELNKSDADRWGGYRVIQIVGTEKGQEAYHSRQDNTPVGFSVLSRSFVPMDFEWNELGPRKRSDPMFRLELSNEMKDAAHEIKFWHSTREWYKERDITWKRGYLLYGHPGCGKTSFVRAIAEKLDIPVFVFDLASLNNSSLSREWNSAIATSEERIILIEDIDNIFDGRKNIAKPKDQQGVTFDKLLNLIDGVEEMDGTLVFVTTNNLEKVDPALSRPGRLDRCIEFAPLNRDAKKRLAASIMIHANENEIESLISESNDDDTPAQFREKCIQRSLSYHYKAEQCVTLPSRPRDDSCRPPSLR